MNEPLPHLGMPSHRAPERLPEGGRVLHQEGAAVLALVAHKEVVCAGDAHESVERVEASLAVQSYWPIGSAIG